MDIMTRYLDSESQAMRHLAPFGKTRWRAGFGWSGEVCSLTIASRGYIGMSTWVARLSSTLLPAVQYRLLFAGVRSMGLVLKPMVSRH